MAFTLSKIACFFFKAVFFFSASSSYLVCASVMAFLRAVACSDEIVPLDSWSSIIDIFAFADSS